MSEKQFIIVDLDGTIANDDHRFGVWADGGPDEYFSMQHKDTPNLDVCWLLKFIAIRIDICLMIVTCRPERYRAETNSWLERHRIYHSGLLMRPTGDRTPSGELKIRMLEQHFGDKKTVLEQVMFVLEDRDKVVSALREYGLKCWQVRPGKY
jgi:hypothetical protein